MSLEHVQNEHQRLSILLSLDAMPGYETNDSMLKCACNEYGHAMTSDKVRTHLLWLKEQGLVTVKDKDSYLISRITERGQDVARGIATVPGVKRRGA